MELEKLQTFCTLFYASHYVPVFLCGNGNTPVFSCAGFSDFQPAYHVLKGLSVPQNPCLFSSAEAGMWGRITIQNTGCSLILGPVFSGSITSEMLHGFLSLHDLPVSRKQEVADALNSIPKYSYYRFLNMLAYLHFTLNAKSIDVFAHFDRQRSTYNEKISIAQTAEAVSAMEEVRQHGTYALEQQIIELIRSGDVEHLRSYLSAMLNTTKLQEGKLAENPIRQAKNIFIGAATMFGKSGAIPGGLDVEETYQLIDTYIQECERLSSMEAITALQYNMLIDFTSRVAESKIPEGISADIYDCIQFINNHTNEPIGIDAVAAHIGRSRAYLTEKFKKETGKTVNAYILDKKLAKSKGLLKHTNKSLAQIAYFLCFSSQAYYQTLFKKKFGETPGAYRKRHKGGESGSMA